MDIPEFLCRRHGIQLNAQQSQALEHLFGPVLLLAVPGAGKTTVAVARLANLIANQGVPPEEILTFTFSKAAAQDMARRFSQLFGEAISQPPSFQTIHRFCNRVLQDYARRQGGRFTLIEGRERGPSKMGLLRELYFQVNGEALQEDTGEELAACISYVKNMMIPSEDTDALPYRVAGFEKIFRLYQEKKREQAWIDFDDMLTLTRQVFLRYPAILEEYRGRFRFLCVDEAQDNSRIQHEIIRMLAQKHRNLFMVGDEDQSIYRFRGAYPQALLTFREIYPDGIVLKMEENFRSTQTLVEHANRFIAHNKERYEKSMTTRREKGEDIQVIHLDDLSEQYWQAVRLLREPFSGTTAVIYRNNCSAIPLVDLLEREGMAFSLREHQSSFQRSQAVGDILAFIRLSYDGNDVQAFRRVGFKCGCYLRRNQVYDAVPLPGSDSLLRAIVDSSMEESGLNTGKILYADRVIKGLREKTPLQAIHTVLYDLGYLDFLQRGSHSVAFASHMQKIQALLSVAGQVKTLPALLDRLERLDELAASSQRESAVTLTTAHSAKGLEFDRVILLDLTDSVFPSMGAVGAAVGSLGRGGVNVLMEEEARLFYVAVTRARDALILMESENALGEGVQASRFVSWLMEKEPAPQGLLAGEAVTHVIFGPGIVTSVNRESGTFSLRFSDGRERMFPARLLGDPNYFLTEKK